ncbi:MAG: PKD domain-containing protein [Bacteroidia bacterium]
MLKRILTLSSLFIIIGLQAQQTKVLWIGNSYIYTNNLPLVFQNLALSGGDTVVFDQNTPGGTTLSAHCSNSTTLQKIAQPGWDYVIIQAQSQEPSFPPAQVYSQTLPYAQILDSLVHDANPCAKTVFFMTWGRKLGDTQNCANYPPLCTFEGMTNRLRWGYKQMADTTQSIIAPVGMAWKAVRETNPDLELFSSDNSHPALAGTYLSACVFYNTLFRKTSTGLAYTAGIAAQDVSLMQSLADATFNDSLEVWNIDRWLPEADFSVVNNGLEFSFQQECLNSNSYLWDFGDGNTSVQPNPIHEYAAAGSYEVVLIAGNGCEFDTISATQIAGPTSVSEHLSGQWRVFPNPAGNDVRIQSVTSERFHIAVYSSRGQLVKAFDAEGTLLTLDFSDLETGVYQIICSTRTEQKIFRIMKD